MLSAAGAYGYRNGFTSAQITNFGSSVFGFYDDYIITIGAGQVDSITSSITLGSSSGISRLSMRVYDWVRYGDALPSDRDCEGLLPSLQIPRRMASLIGLRFSVDASSQPRAFS